jgi:pimeloyl-ACP methyl ester carboxylesterase
MPQPYEDFTYRSADGLRLAGRLYGTPGSGGRRPVVCLPGLTRNARDFHEIAQYLSEPALGGRPVVAFDYRGRGMSDRDPDRSHYSVGVEAADVLAGLDALGIGKADFIGTSRGGLIVHVLTAMRLEAIAAVVLNDIGPEVGIDGFAHIQSYLANRTRPASFAEAVAAQRAVHGPAFPGLDAADWERMTRAIYRDDHGRPVADYDPAIAEMAVASDLSKGLPTLWPQFEALVSRPVMVIRGANSALLTAETLQRMKARHPALEVVTVAGQGHPPLLETGDLPGLIRAFLDRADGPAV